MRLKVKATTICVSIPFPEVEHGSHCVAFAENLILIANPSKSGGEWWYGKIPSTGKAGLFPKAYVQPVVQSECLLVYPDPANISLSQGHSQVFL